MTEAAARRPRTRKPATEPEAAGAAFAPMDPAAERAVIAALLSDPTNVYAVTQAIDADDFATPACAALFRTIVSLDALGKPLDEITIAADLRRSKQLDLVGGTAGIRALLADVTETASVEAHAEIVAERALSRRLLRAAREIAVDAVDLSAPARDALGRAEELIFNLGRARSGSTLQDMASAVAAVMKDLAKGRDKLLLGYGTGFAGLDRLTAGLQPGQLWCLAARPGMGKTALGLTVGKNVAETTDKYVVVLSYEMSTNEIMMRLLSGDLRYNAMDLARGDFKHVEGLDARVSEVAAHLANLKIVVDDNPPRTLAGISSMLRRLARQYPIGVVVIDYLGLMQGDTSRRDASRSEEVGSLSRGLKLLAKELDVAILVLAQLNRGPEQRPNKRPVLSDLRDSGEIEQDCNVVIFLFRNYEYDKNADPTHAEAIVAKNRSGPQGAIALDWFGEFTLFCDSDRVLAEPSADEGVAAAAASGHFSRSGF